MNESEKNQQSNTLICQSCGAQNANDAKFCAVCGKPLNVAVNPTAEAKPEASNMAIESSKVATNKVNTTDIANKIQSIPKKVLCACGAGLALLVIAIAIFMHIGKTINLNDYVIFDEKGYNGYGEIEVTFDAKLYDKCTSKMKFTSKGKKEYGSSREPVDVFFEAIHMSFKKNGEAYTSDEPCSNGDVITLVWEIDEELISNLNCKLKYTDMEYTISSLEDIDTFDAFAGIELSFAGMSPHGTLEFTYTGNDLTTSDFTVDKASDLKNGDTVTVSLNDNLNYYATRLGKMPEATSKEYTVEGLDEYILSVDKITDEFKNQLKSETEIAINSYVTEYYSNYTNRIMENLEYAGYIFAANTNTDNTSWYNRFYIIYKADVSSAEGKFSPTKVYYPVKFRDIIATSKELYYSKSDGIIGSAFMGSNGAYNTKGYLNPFDLYLDVKNDVNGYTNLFDIVFERTDEADAYSLTAGDGFEVYCTYENIEALSDIPEDYKQNRYSQTTAVIEKYISSTYSSKWNVPDLKYLGEYLLVPKNQDSDYPKNKHIIVFSGTATNLKGTGETATIFYPVEYDSLIKLGSGECMYSSGGDTDDILGQTRLADRTITRGYLDGVQMYTDIISANKAEYTYDISETLKIFGD